jgi:hypothetical protein
MLNFNQASLPVPENSERSKKKVKVITLVFCILLLFFIVAMFVVFKIKNYFTEPQFAVSSQAEEARIPFFESETHSILLLSNNYVIDFASIVDDRNNIHIVYNTKDKGSFYIQGKPQENLWSKPDKLPFYGLPKIVQTSEGLHILLRSGHEIFHLLSSDNGGTWQELPPIVKADRFIPAYDVITTGNNIVVAFTTAEQGVVDVTTVDIKVLNWSSKQISENEKTLPVTVASFQSMYTNSPIKLAAGNNILHLVYGTNGQDASSHIFYSKSDNNGSTWITPVEVSLAGGESSRGTINGGIQLLERDSLNLFVADNKLYLFYRDMLPFLTTSKDGTDWSPAVALSSYGSTGADKKTIDIASSNNSTRIVWIDGRFELMTPQFGIPWSDNNPYWGNNDIFSATVSDSRGQLQMFSNKKLEDELPIYRLTKPISFVRSVSIHPIENKFLVIWSGVNAQEPNNFRSKNSEHGLFYIILPD